MTVARKKIVLIMVPAALLFAAAAVYSTFINYAPHFFSETECFECHFTIPQPGDPGPMRFQDRITKLCGRCHGGLSAVSHVVDVVPSVAIPPDMPLNALGMITCATCHDPHRNRVDSRTGRKTYYLRSDKRDREYCLLCHEDPNRPGKVAIYSKKEMITHRRSMTRTHGFVNFSVVDPGEGLDNLSLLCISCHREDEGEADLKSLGKGIWSHGGGIGITHPVGVDYDDASWRSDDLVDIRHVDKRVKFFDGRIGCCSCHDLYAVGGGAGLVIGERGAYLDLCLACHNM